MAPTLDPRSSLETLYRAVLFTLVRLRLDPRLQPFAPPFEQALLEWWDIFKQQRALLDNLLSAEASVDYTDAQLNDTSDGVAGTLLVETKNNRKSPIFVRYFGTQQPNRFRRSVLGPQLTAMRAWPPSLKASQNPTLQAYGEAIEKHVKAADEAMLLTSEAEQKIIDFRTTGPRKLLFDKVNGIRKQLHGDVSKMIDDHPEWKLTRDYVDALFEHTTSSSELTDAELDRKIEVASAEVSKLTALRDQRIKDEQAAVAEIAEIERKAKLAALEAAEKAAAEANAKIAALKAELSPA